MGEWDWFWRYAVFAMAPVQTRAAVRDYARSGHKIGTPTGSATNVIAPNTPFGRALHIEGPATAGAFEGWTWSNDAAYSLNRSGARSTIFTIAKLATTEAGLLIKSGEFGFTCFPTGAGYYLFMAFFGANSGFTGTELSFGQWRSHAVTWTPGVGGVFYVNGSHYRTWSGGLVQANTSSALALGSDDSCNYEVACSYAFRTILSQAQIRQLHADPFGPFRVGRTISPKPYSKSVVDVRKIQQKPMPWSWKRSLLAPSWRRLAERLQFCAPMWGERPVNLVDGQFASAVDTGVGGIGRHGRSYLTVADNDRAVWPNRTKWSLGPWPWSLCLVVDVTGSPVSDAFCGAQGGAKDEEGEWSFEINGSLDHAFVYFSGAAARTIDFNDGLAGAGFQVVCLSRNAAGVWRCWKNGKLLGSVTESVAPVTQVRDFTLANERGGGSAQAVKGHYYATYIWRDYALTDDDARMLWADPFGLLRPEIRSRPRLAAGQVIAIGQATEQDVAQAMTWSRRLTLGLAAETDLAQAITARKVYVLGQAIETDLAQAVTHARRVTIGLSTEQDLAFAITRRKVVALGLSTETDTAFAVTRLKRAALGLAQEQDVALGITAVSGAALGIATETDLAFAITHKRAKAVDQATETDLALGVNRIKRLTLGLAAETDLALGVTAKKVKVVQVGQASESDLALAMTYARALAVGMAFESDLALAVIIVGGATLLVGKYADEHAEALAAIEEAGDADYSSEHAEALQAIEDAGY